MKYNEMKNCFWSALAAGALALCAPAAFAQETQDAAPAAGQVGAQAAEEDKKDDRSRPVMPRLFFSNEQRRILEVVRQEFITEAALEFEEFVPFVLAQQELVEEVEDVFLRNEDFRVDALVRNRKTGAGAMWLNSDQYGFEDVSGALNREGLTEIAPELDGTSIVGIDIFNNSRFVVKVGQKLIKDGEVDETYPVVIVKRK
ncbi:MAG: hypothetical protein ACR2P5_07405 [Gammaproteobacteria bacterium]